MKYTIVISAVNFRSGGPLSVLNDCLQYLDYSLSSKYKIVALVHDKSIVNKTENIEYIEFPKSVSSYFFRLYYEYIYFNKLSKALKPYLWLSLHDMSPKVEAKIQAVYCHNPSPFYRVALQELFLDPKFVLFSWLYKWVYRLNIEANDYVIVQQEWLRNKFIKMYNIKNIIVAYPDININISSNAIQSSASEKVRFFYPSFPRVFKNFEIICEAASRIQKKYQDRFEILLTINGNENRYARWLYNNYSHLENIKFVGLQSREKVYEIYAKTDCLVFPSKLETWGMPISEFKNYDRAILLADLGYAYETIGNYDKVKFFDPDNPEVLAQLMGQVVEGDISFDDNNVIKPLNPHSTNWSGLFEILLNKG